MNDHLREMQAWSLQMKVFHSIEVIQTFMAKTAEIRGGGKIHQMVIMFLSVVVQTVLCYLILRGVS